MKRVLALHGHFQNARVLRGKLEHIQSACKDYIEFVTLDAPHILYPVDPPSSMSVASSSSLATSRRFENDEHDLRPRCWWRYLADTHDTDAVIESLAHIRAFLEEHGPFDGLLGFSQGSAMAAMVAGWLEEPEMQPHFKNVDHPPFQFVILISGFIIPSPLFPLPAKIKAPSLHVIGYNDTMVKPEWPKDLARRFDSAGARVEMHEGGHFIPRRAAWTQFFAEWLASAATLCDSPYSTAPSTPDLSSSSSISSRKSNEGAVSPYLLTPVNRVMELTDSGTRIVDVHDAVESPLGKYGSDDSAKISIIRPYAKTDNVDIMRFVKMASETLSRHVESTPSTYETIKSPTPARYHDELILYIEVQNPDGTISLVESEPVSPRI
ncbi:hypothetical protein PUNSTDRAFT_134146 [Punctularia strigosozonata HHB-11173 SS5]|uniref:uncharacterized protein n=1 Tax=Punctularia strigosozonata (strain HHB-11173) TaxID=741275 RepID=UPI0004416FAB|nr:uncharacterized protein PUNSTDRAFT_134146 [Punctularia strigosozonata HHB-11173 SS5]EIN08973.1 hypothetical protein PUNSTDRAFT_134146 [Punctularia strigosozonata HHB-11173 SS5]